MTRRATTARNTDIPTWLPGKLIAAMAAEVIEYTRRRNRNSLIEIPALVHGPIHGKHQGPIFSPQDL
jgi:hypothetical protein